MRVLSAGFVGFAIAAALVGPAPEASAADVGEAAAPTWIGSAKCVVCHGAQGEAWKDSPHARTLHPIGDTDRTRLAESLMCAQQPIERAVGIKRHVRYLARDASGVERVLPCRWNRAGDAWDSVGSEPGPVWNESCGWCHETGHATHPDAVHEAGVGCESCHGPGSAHAANPTQARVFAFPADQPAAAASVCGSCHLQGGLTKDGITFPKGFVPGTDLRQVFTFDWKGLDTAAGDHHAQSEIRTVLAGTSSERVCLSCHDPHRQTAEGHAKHPQGPLCAQCHVDGSAKLKADREAVCPVCEM